MKSTFAISFKHIAFLILILSAGLIIGCKKPPTVGVIKAVRLVDGTILNGAELHLQVDSNPKSGIHLSDLGFVHEYKTVTNSSGTKELEFELPALVTVVATFINDTSALVGTGKLNLVANETTNLTIEMN